MSNLIKNWNNKNIRIRSDRYVSLTDMAQATSKRVNNWLRLDSTKSYLEALSRSTQIGATDLVQVIQGGDPQSQGTWALISHDHPLANNVLYLPLAKTYSIPLL